MDINIQHDSQHVTEDKLYELMEKQPLINIGMIGHVANGKSSITKCLSEKETQQFSKEKEKNITIRLGYANAKIWKCVKCDEPQCYSSSHSSVNEKDCSSCNTKLRLVNHVSIVDCPGHSELTSTMLNGSCVMDYTMLVEACNNEKIPAPQTAEHLIATQIAKIPTAYILMNKIDLVDKNVTKAKINELTTHIKSLNISQSPIAPIIPISGTFGTNIDVLCQYLSYLKVPNERDLNSPLKMMVIRSFDINKPGVKITELNGGVIGGTIMRGQLSVGDKINIYPGLYKKINSEDNKQPMFKYKPITGKVLSIKSEQNNLSTAVPGGLLGIQLTIDPGFTRNDNLAGSIVLKAHNDMSDTKVLEKIILKMDNIIVDENEIVMSVGNKLRININSNNVDCVVKKYSKKKKELYLILDKPIVTNNINNDNITQSIDTNNVTVLSPHKSNMIIGRGYIIEGVECALMK